MRPAEAKAIRDALESLDPAAINPALNLGSSTIEFRTAVQPHINAQVIAPLESRGVLVVHADLRPDEGVDIAGDIFDASLQDKLRKLGAKLIICSNMMEHVADRNELASVLRTIIAPGGFLLVTVPRSYPYHPDPIDTGFRPPPEGIIAMFPGYETVWSAIVEDCTYWDDLRRLKPWPRARFLLGSALRFPLYLGSDRERFRTRFHRFLWLFRCYSASAVLLRRPVQP
jgi:SAM-dependent methyltransferase